MIPYSKCASPNEGKTSSTHGSAFPPLAPPFPPHFPVLARFPAAAGRVLHVGGLGAVRGGWSAGMSPRPFCPNRHRAIQPRLTLSVYPSSQLQFGSRLSSLPPSLPSFLLELWFGNSTRSYFASLFNLGEGRRSPRLSLASCQPESSE